MNPDDIFDICCSDGAPRSQHGDTIITGRPLTTREVEPITETLAQHRALLTVRSQLDAATWMLDDPTLFSK